MQARQKKFAELFVVIGHLITNCSKATIYNKKKKDMCCNFQHPRYNQENFTTFHAKTTQLWFGLDTLTLYKWNYGNTKKGLTSKLNCKTVQGNFLFKRVGTTRDLVHLLSKLASITQAVSTVDKAISVLHTAQKVMTAQKVHNDIGQFFKHSILGYIP